MTERPVLVLDSGIGGLPYVSAARQLLPERRFVYVADHAGFPYGEQAPERLRSMLLELVGRSIERENPTAVLVACNTASVVALEALRRAYPAPFVGVVPAVKPAAAASRSRRIGVLATARTVEAHYLRELVGQFARDAVVTAVAAGEIVRLVEEGSGNPSPERVRQVVGPAVARLRQARVDIVVLGCTHFVYLLQQLEELLGPDVTVIDSREGVVRRLQRVVEAGEAVAAGDGEPPGAHAASEVPGAPGAPEAHAADCFYTTGAVSSGLTTLARQFGFAEVQQL